MLCLINLAMSGHDHGVLQAEIAKKFLRFIPEQHHRRGILTPLDSSFHPAVLDAFISENRLDLNERGVRDPRAFGLISGIVNPVRTLMKGVEVRALCHARYPSEL